MSQNKPRKPKKPRKPILSSNPSEPSETNKLSSSKKRKLCNSKVLEKGAAPLADNTSTVSSLSSSTVSTIGKTAEKLEEVTEKKLEDAKAELKDIKTDIKEYPMVTYISLLRGINVSGQKKIKMEELKRSYESLGFTGVRTYIQSGNVIFNTPQSDTLQLSKKIEEEIKDEFGFQVTVLLRSPDDLNKIISGNPFLKNENIDVSKLHVTFLQSVPAKHVLSSMKKVESGADKFYISDREIYIYCPNRYGRTKLTNTYFEKVLSIAATTRNWNSVNNLSELARKY